MKLIGRHAEDVGNGRIVEPGEELPADVDEKVLERLKRQGKVYEGKTVKKSTAKES